MSAKSKIPERIYLDNAATSYPKPAAVWEAMDRFSREIGASAGRGAYEEAFECARLLQQTRERLATLFNAPDPERFIFTLNATSALNLAIKASSAPATTSSPASSNTTPSCVP
jgi:selenocysteine lyase/cysteine desulfurase